MQRLAEGVNLCFRHCSCDSWFQSVTDHEKNENRYVFLQDDNAINHESRVVSEDDEEGY